MTSAVDERHAKTEGLGMGGQGDLRVPAWSGEKRLYFEDLSLSLDPLPEGLCFFKQGNCFLGDTPSLTPQK